MLNLFKVGDKKKYHVMVGEEDTATFESGMVHPFYATFALGRDAEWSSRLFVLDMKEADEEGIGTFLNINHLSPALLNDVVNFEATIDRLQGNSIECTFTAMVGERLIAEGRTGQKIIKKEKLALIMRSLHGR